MMILRPVSIRKLNNLNCKTQGPQVDGDRGRERPPPNVDQPPSTQRGSAISVENGARLTCVEFREHSLRWLASLRDAPATQKLGWRPHGLDSPFHGSRWND